MIRTILAACLLTSGCSLIPHRVEYFQDKVKAVPAKTAAQVETEKQAAKFVATKTGQAVTAATAEGCSTNVVAPAREANTAADALSGSLGAPSEPWTATADALAAKLDRLDAKLDAKLERYRAEVAPNVGRKIEGSGLFSLSFFTQWGLFLGAVALVWLGLKAYGLFNPVVGLGMNIAGRVPSRVLHTGFKQVVSAGEAFKDYLAGSPLSGSEKSYVSDIFRRAHMETQSPETQAIIQQLTK